MRAVRRQDAFSLIEHALVERARETLLSAERDEEMAVAPVVAPPFGAVVGERQSLADRSADGRSIGPHPFEPFARVTRANGSDAPHSADHRRKLPHRADARDDVGEPLRHDSGPASARTASTNFFRATSSQAPVFITAATTSGANASSCAATRPRISPTFGGRGGIEHTVG